MNYQDKKRQAIQLIKEDNYPEALVLFSVLYRENPHDEEVVKASNFLFQRIIEGNYDFVPQTAEEFMFRGVAKFYHGQLDSSIADFDQSLSMNPTDHYVMKCKAFSLLHKGEPFSAIPVLEKAIEIEPRGEYFDDLADIYARLRNNEMALQNHKYAVTHSPDDPRLWYNYGVFLAENGNIHEAVKQFDKALELWPEYPDALHNKEYYSQLL